jgi:DNA-binding LytR/AlgR family response regulator
MKIIVNKKKDPQELKITIEGFEEDEQIEQIVNLISSSPLDFIAKKDGRGYRFNLDQVFYIESIEEQCFLYTKDDVYDCKYRLYEVEDSHPFMIRINKNIVLNYKKIKNFKSTYNGKLETTLVNQDRLEISRRYVSQLKKVLGGINQ